MKTIYFCRGYQIVKRRMCDMVCGCKLRSFRWWTLMPDGSYTGDNFRLLRDAVESISKDYPFPLARR